LISAGPKSSESESESSTEKEATAKSKAIHARYHVKREQEKKGKHEAAKRKGSSKRKIC
jgi:hypothetical protein